MNFASDNVAGAHPLIVEALARAAAAGPMASYGADPLTAGLARRLGEVFEREVAVFPVISGTAANALALSCLTPPWGGVLAHCESHVEADECGAVEALSGGARLLTVEGAHGKIDPEGLRRRLSGIRPGDQHQVQPAAVTITQATEAGTLYTPGEVAALGAFARERGLKLHMDGARFANALAALGCTPAEITWKAGVDVLSFGATKNGALAAEAVIFFDPERGREFVARRKRSGHLLSKMRFLSAQLLAYLEDDLWLANARHANAQAARLAAGLGRVAGGGLEHPVEANEIFARLPLPLAQALAAAGAAVRPWGAPPADPAAPGLYRFITAFDTPDEAVDAFLALLENQRKRLLQSV